MSIYFFIIVCFYRHFNLLNHQRIAKIDDYTGFISPPVIFSLDSYQMLSHNQISIHDKIIVATNSIKEKPSEEVRDKLIMLINELINNDFHALVQLLYRIDVDEKKLKQLLQQHPGSDSASTITDLIIRRQLQKIATKKQFNPREEPGPDDSW